MGQFLEKPKIEIGRPGQFMTCGRTVYLSDLAGEIVVPPMETDFASVPSIVPRRLFDPMRHGRWAAVVHDYLCRHHAKSHADRVLADKVFREALLDEQPPMKKWRVNGMYWAVRANTFRMWLMGKWR